MIHYHRVVHKMKEKLLNAIKKHNKLIITIISVLIIAGFSGGLISSNSKNEELSSQINELLTQVEDLSSKIEEQDKSIINLQDEISSKDDTITKLQDTIDENEYELRNANIRIAELSKLEDQQEIIDSQKETIEKLDSKIVTLQETIEERDNQISDLKSQLSSNQSRNSSSSSSSFDDDSNYAGGTVYWVPNGKVYHSTPNCSTLSRSKTIYSGTISESGKSRGCKRCY